MKDQLKVAIVHDWLIHGGAERVVEQLHVLYPDAPIYTSYCAPIWRQKLGGVVRTGWLQSWPFSKIRKLIPFLRAWSFSHLDLREYDLVIASSGAEAKGVKRLKPGANFIAYIHAPTHYYWSRYDEYLQNPGLGAFNWLGRFGLKLLVGPMRRWDYKAAQRPQQLIANSSYTKEQIKKYYGREATVIHPPVDTVRFRETDNIERKGFLIAGRQTPYKRFDLAVTACGKLNLPLTVIGNGPDNVRLRNLAGPTVQFLNNVPDSDMPRHFASAQAFIFPGLDDFGITPIEAMAAGTPVIAYKAGGALDYIRPETGQFFDQPTADSLAEVLAAFKPASFDHQKISQAAEDFSIVAFKTKMQQFLEQVQPAADTQERHQ